MKTNFRKFLKHHNVALPLAVLVLSALIYQGQRSSWPASFEHWSRVVNYKLLGHQQISGNFISKVDVKWHRQEHSLSCEIAALKIALSAYGVDVPESDLIRRLAFDPTRRSGGIWGDPYTGFVGDIDGKMGVTGYGVYWDPIAKVGNNYRRSEAVRISTPAELAAHISAGRPVIMWGYFGRGNRIEWTTPAGRQISAVNGEHARVVAGFSGDASAPTAFEVYDPIYGQLSWTPEELFKNAEPFDYMSVVVYPDPKWVKLPGIPTVWEIFPDKTRRALAMAWPDFLARGGSLEAIKIIDPFELDVFLEGPVITAGA